MSRTVADEAKWASTELEDICIDIEACERQYLVKIIDVELSVAKTFYDKFDVQYKDVIHPGEKETLAFLCNSPENWLVCSADKAVFRVLGLLGKSDKGISLEEVLKEIGLSQELEWQYTKKFRQKWTHAGNVDSIQDKGFV